MIMPNIFKDYPGVPWEQGWRIASDAEDAAPFFTAAETGQIRGDGESWTLELPAPSPQVTARLFSNALSLRTRKNSHDMQALAVAIEPGILTGSTLELPPQLRAEDAQQDDPGLTWVKNGSRIALLLCRDSRFALVTGEYSRELAVLKAEEALELSEADLIQTQTDSRRRTAGLFSINPRHNPPVALAAESLRQRLRGRTAALHGVWSTADGFASETFSLNELYPLAEAWLLIEPSTAMDLVKTAMTLQQSSGGFPAWVDCQGVVSSAAPWPLIIQSFELAWQEQSDPALLRKTMPALRKYMQWALRYFDPHRDKVPAWQSEQEIFVPGSFERGKATPDLTVMLICELEALLRLCDASATAGTAAAPLREELDQLTRTLTSIFWNPEIKAFSNTWKEGHYKHEPSFGSFLPLFHRSLPTAYRAPLLEKFEETHGFPGHEESGEWNKEQIDDAAGLPVIHQFMTLQALRRADANRALLMLFVRRARDGFAAWFERESIQAARHKPRGEANAPAFGIGPVTAALLLSTQAEFQQTAAAHTPTLKSLQRWIHRMRFTTSDLKILAGVITAMVFIHMLYNIPRADAGDARIAEAALNYSQGRFRKAMQLCRRYPDHPLSQFLQANLFMLTDNPAKAEPLYLAALRSETASPSALFGYALALQLNGNFDQAVKRYNDFIDIYEVQPQIRLTEFAYEFLRLSEEEFSRPPKWKRVYALPEMNDLGL
jgi:tetratricopeptide (TPR) repeat protein